LRRPNAQISPSANRDAAHKRIVGRHAIAGGIAVGHPDVDPQHLAEQRRRILRVVVRIVAAATIAEADVEVAVGSEHEVAAVVIRERLADEPIAAGPSEIEPRRGIRDERIRRPPKPRDHGVAVRVGKVHEHATARRVGVEGHPEQPLLSTRGDRRSHVQERRR
jgi:hypothetical protein